MSLDVHVVPGVLNVLATLVPAGNMVPAEVTGGATGASTAPIKGMSYGPRFSVPLTPWAWVQNSSFNEAAPEGAGLISTPWVMLCRLFSKYADDQPHAERLLGALIGPIRDAFRTNTRLLPWGTSTMGGVRRSYVSGGEWGYMDINGIPYRYVDLNIAVEEKEAKSYQ